MIKIKKKQWNVPRVQSLSVISTQAASSKGGLDPVENHVTTAPVHILMNGPQGVGGNCPFSTSFDAPLVTSTTDISPGVFCDFGPSPS